MFCAPHGNRNCPSPECRRHRSRAASPAAHSTDDVLDPLRASAKPARKTRSKDAAPPKSTVSGATSPDSATF